MKTFTVPANGVNFYCEQYGSGPTLFLMPDGCNDCGTFARLIEPLQQHFTVLTFDPRGGSRSMDPHPQNVTAEMLADDIAAVVRALDLGPVSAYGCSSGGQTVLTLGKRHPDLVRNIMVHEAALQSDAPLPDAGFIFFDSVETLRPYLNGFSPGTVWGVGTAEGVEAIKGDCQTRINENKAFWSKYYRGTVDQNSYSAEDFASMPPVAFTVGTWTPAWLIYANIETAKRGNCPLTWLHTGHHPERTCPDTLAAHIIETTKPYL